MAQARPRLPVRTGRVPLLFLDANVLIPATLRSIFLDLAEAGVARVFWSGLVLAEVRRNLVKPRFGLTPAQINKLFGQMGVSFPDAMIRNTAALERRFAGKIDSKDVHVAAGALALTLPPYGSNVAVLVTSNLRHFPDPAFVGTNVRTAQPRVVLKALLAADARVPDILETMLRRFGKPPLAREDLLESLYRMQCRAFATALAAAWGLHAED